MNFMKYLVWKEYERFWERCELKVMSNGELKKKATQLSESPCPVLSRDNESGGAGGN